MYIHKPKQISKSEKFLHTLPSFVAAFPVTKMIKLRKSDSETLKWIKSLTSLNDFLNKNIYVEVHTYICQGRIQDFLKGGSQLRHWLRIKYTI